MREIKFKYGYSNGISIFEKAFTLDEIEQGLQFDEISDSRLLKDYKIVYRRQYTELKDKNNLEIYESDIVKNMQGKISQINFKEDYAKYEAFDEDFSWVVSDTYEVIGNIYESKEL